MEPSETAPGHEAIDRLRAALSLDKAELTPMETVRRRYVRTARDTALRDRFDAFLLDLAERTVSADPGSERQEANILLVLAKAGAGKTRSITRLFAIHPALGGLAPNGPGCPVLSVTAPSPCGVAELGRAILEATAYGYLKRRLNGPEIWTIVRRRLTNLGILVLHIDEAQHATQLRDHDERQKLRNTLKGIAINPEHPVGIMLSGLPEIVEFLEPDQQLLRRSHWYKVAPVTLPDERSILTKTLTLNGQTVGLRVETDEVGRLLPRLVHASDARLGILVEETHGAMRVALAEGADELRVEHFAQAFALRTGNAPTFNPYLRADFAAIDVWRILAEHELSPVKAKRETPGRGRKGREDK